MALHNRTYVLQCEPVYEGRVLHDVISITAAGAIHLGGGRR